MEQDNLEVLDVENYKGGKDQQFSHQVLVMNAMSKCIDAGTKEMRTGYYNEKRDKFGNIVLVYITDTRKEFIESIKTVEMVMACDIDDDSKKKIKKIKEELDGEFKKLCKEEEEDWNNITVTIRQDRWSKGIRYHKGTLNRNLPFYQEYIDFEVDCYRSIFSELTILTKRLNFYQEEDYEA